MELPDDAELGIACDALKDVGLDHVADLLVELVKDRRQWESERLESIVRLQRTIMADADRHAGSLITQFGIPRRPLDRDPRGPRTPPPGALPGPDCDVGS
jgi:hypothetical protein